MTDSANAPTRPKTRWRRWALEALVFVVVLAGFQMWQLRDSARGPAPVFSGALLDGNAFALADWRAAHPGRPVLLYFWAEWCPVCKTTAGSVTSVAGDWPVTSIAIQSGAPGAVAAVMRERGYGWPTLADPGGDISRQYGLPGVPAFVIIGPGGEIRFVMLGYTSEIGLRLRLWWAGRGS